MKLTPREPRGSNGSPGPLVPQAGGLPTPPTTAGAGPLYGDPARIHSAAAVGLSTTEDEAPEPAFPRGGWVGAKR